MCAYHRGYAASDPQTPNTPEASLRFATTIDTPSHFRTTSAASYRVSTLSLTRILRRGASGLDELGYGSPWRRRDSQSAKTYARVEREGRFWGRSHAGTHMLCSMQLCAGTPYTPRRAPFGSLRTSSLRATLTSIQDGTRRIVVLEPIQDVGPEPSWRDVETYHSGVWKSGHAHTSTTMPQMTPMRYAGSRQLETSTMSTSSLRAC
ncbi:hypothetical protein GY45DRAFT_297689 [Cubamyces sp. BRFM 1775]|nr:hypothetical protein GY45DRAFT_297689 [Cubamyces sp. BRFM 1775]